MWLQVISESLRDSGCGLGGPFADLSESVSQRLLRGGMIGIDLESEPIPPLRSGEVAGGGAMSQHSDPDRLEEFGGAARQNAPFALGQGDMTVELFMLESLD